MLRRHQRVCSTSVNTKSAMHVLKDSTAPSNSSSCQCPWVSATSPTTGQDSVSLRQVGFGLGLEKNHSEIDEEPKSMTYARNCRTREHLARQRQLHPVVRKIEIRHGEKRCF